MYISRFLWNIWRIFKEYQFRTDEDNLNLHVTVPACNASWVQSVNKMKDQNNNLYPVITDNISLTAQSHFCN
jgi:hypothetical protein